MIEIEWLSDALTSNEDNCLRHVEILEIYDVEYALIDLIEVFRRTE